jgi:hypothetical protein
MKTLTKSSGWMAGLNRKSPAELTTYYQKLITLLADECSEWLKTLDKR